MNRFARLNVISLFLAFAIFIQMQFVNNTFRLSRILDISDETFSSMEPILLILLFIICVPIILFKLIRNWTGKHGMNYLLMILWLPYLWIMMEVFELVFPFTHYEDYPNLAMELIIFFYALLYPFYLLIIILFSHKKK